MKLSTKGRYGLRALADIALHSDGVNAVSLHSIAERQNISEGYLEQLMVKLRKAGLVKSIRGARGGYLLACPPEEIRAGDALRALEGSVTPVDCAGETGECSIADSCVTKNLWRRINHGITDMVDNISLRELIEECEK